MNRRLALHQELVDLLVSYGDWYWDPFNFETGYIPESIQEEAEARVYFQPPESMRLQFPCFIYSRTGANQTYANDKDYMFRQKYSLTYVTRDPDTQEIVTRIKKTFDYCGYDSNSPMVYDNLYHEMFTLYY